ncbi:unnamed protein product, partial [Tetraodon nigroviridis]
LRSFSAASVEVRNEPILDYREGSGERAELLKALDRVKRSTEEIPCVVGDQHVWTRDVRYQLSPFNHSHKVAKFCYADKELINKAILASVAARREWDLKPVQDRAQVLFKAADVISGPRRAEILAKTMIGQVEPPQPDSSRWTARAAPTPCSTGAWRSEVTRPAPPPRCSSRFCPPPQGFVAAVAPFNFTAIGGNLAGTPALMVGGASSRKRPCHRRRVNKVALCVCPGERGPLEAQRRRRVRQLRRLLGPAGLRTPPGHHPVPAGRRSRLRGRRHPRPLTWPGSTSPAASRERPLSSWACVCVCADGPPSSRTFRHLWKQVAQNLDSYRTFPRLAGECGGKNFHFVHASADVLSVVNGTVRSAFEYGGQKCSACSRLYVPDCLWPQIRQQLLDACRDIRVGDPVEDFSTFFSAVIDDKSFARIRRWLEHARTSPSLKVLAGGSCDDSKGYFVEPTIVETTDPQDAIMCEEIFGPVLTVYVYPEKNHQEVLELIDRTSPYGLTGSVYAQDQRVIDQAARVLRNAAGNYYVNDKSTGSIVAQQPFGGARVSGTNDKPGGPHYVLSNVGSEMLEFSEFGTAEFQSQLVPAVLYWNSSAVWVGPPTVSVSWTGVVSERLLSDYLHHVFPSSKPSLRKPLGFQDLGAHLETLLSEGQPTEDSRDPPADGRLGPQPVVLDHTSGFEGLLFVDDDLLGEGVGDTPDSYAYDGNRVRKWNVTTTNYGKVRSVCVCVCVCVSVRPSCHPGNACLLAGFPQSWAAGDIVSCLMDLDEGTIVFCL